MATISFPIFWKPTTTDCRRRLSRKQEPTPTLRGFPFRKSPTGTGEEPDPYIFDGSMSIEDYELMHRLIDEERSRQQMSEQFSVLIDSRTRFETGHTGRRVALHADYDGAASRSYGKASALPQRIHRIFSSMDLQTPNSSPFDVPLPLSRAQALTN